MDAPDGEVDAFRFERLMPGEHVMVDAVDERAVEIEEKRDFRLGAGGIHRPILSRHCTA